MSTTNFEILESKGRDLYDTMVSGARANVYVALPDISRPTGGYRTCVKDMGRPGINSEQRRMMEMAGVPREWYRSVNVVPPGVSENTPVYYNLVHTEGKAIVCLINFADRDTLSPDRDHWSDLLAVSCDRAVNRDRITGGPRRDMSALLAICRLNIVNPETTAVIRKLAAECDPHPDDVLTLRAGDADFFSLLGTQNGKGLAWMLGTYPSKFGRKVITSALVTCSKPNICWMLEDVENVPETVEEAAAMSSP